MRTTVDLEAHLLKRLRAEAHRTGTSLKDVLSRVLRKGLEDAPRSPAGKYECPSFSMGRPIPERLDKALALAATIEDDEVAREITLRK